MRIGSVSDLTADDIHRMCSEEWQEDAHFELKSDLPSQDGYGTDKWHDGQSDIGKYARDEIAAEVIAFANAGGGMLVIGMSETDTVPKRASNPRPVPKCQDLAERLLMRCRDMAEPVIGTISGVGVPLSDDGSGVVVMQVGASPRRPHRHAKTKEFYTRRRDRTEKMGVDEIRDLILYTASMHDQVESKLSSMAKEARAITRIFHTDPAQRGVRSSCIFAPLQPVHIDGLQSLDKLRPGTRGAIVTVQAGNHSPFDIETTFPMSGDGWRPILRGVRAIEGSPNRTWLRQIGADGSVVYAVGYRLSPNVQEPVADFFYSWRWLMAQLVHGLRAVDGIRAHLGAPSLEFALVVEFETHGGEVPLRESKKDSFGDYAVMPGGLLKLPAYSIGSTDEFSSVLTAVDQDLWNALGETRDRHISANWNDPRQSAQST